MESILCRATTPEHETGSGVWLINTGMLQGKEVDFLFPSMKILQIASWLELGPCVHFPFSMLRFCLV